MSRDIRITMLVFAVMCLAAGSNLIFFQGTRFRGIAVVEPVARSRALGSPQSDAGASAQAAAEAAVTPAAPTLLNWSLPQAKPERTGSVADASTPAVPTMDAGETVRGIQKGLAARGYEPGASDGIAGLITRAAIMAYEYDNGLVMTGEPTPELMKHMLVGAAGQPAGRRGVPEVRGTEAIAIVKWVARQLDGLGYRAGAADGGLSEVLTKAIRDYEAAQNIAVTGRISAPLVSRLTRPPAATRAASASAGARSKRTEWITMGTAVADGDASDAAAITGPPVQLQ